MTYRYSVTLDVPDAWQGPGSRDGTQAATAEGLAKEIEFACQHIVPTSDCGVMVCWDEPKPAPKPAPEDFYNGVHLSNVTPGHVLELERIYTPEQMKPLLEAVARYNNTSGKTDLERHGQIHIDARGGQVDVRPEGKRRQARCGNCLERYDITDDAVQNHHLAMLHKQVCKPVGGGAMYSEEQRERLIDEFNAQPHVLAMRQRFEATGNVLPASPNMPAPERPAIAAKMEEVDRAIERIERIQSDKKLSWWQRFMNWFNS